MTIETATQERAAALTTEALRHWAQRLEIISGTHVVELSPAECGELAALLRAVLPKTPPDEPRCIGCNRLAWHAGRGLSRGVCSGCEAALQRYPNSAMAERIRRWRKENA